MKIQCADASGAFGPGQWWWLALPWFLAIAPLPTAAQSYSPELLAKMKRCDSEQSEPITPSWLVGYLIEGGTLAHGRSRCYDLLASLYGDTRLCAQVVQRRFPFIDGSWYSPKKCVERVRKRIADDQANGMDPARIRRLESVQAWWQGKEIRIRARLLPPPPGAVDGLYSTRITTVPFPGTPQLRIELSPENAVAAQRKSVHLVFIGERQSEVELVARSPLLEQPTWNRPTRAPGGPLASIKLQIEFHQSLAGMSRRDLETAQAYQSAATGQFEGEWDD